MIDGMGSPNITAIFDILEYEELIDDEIMLEKIKIYVLAAIQERQRERPNKVIKNKNTKRK